MTFVRSLRWMQRLGVAYLAPKGMKFDDKKFLHLLGTTMDKIQDHFGAKLTARVSIFFFCSRFYFCSAL